jgi:DNA-binding NarL/FixJ family response regulator
MRRASVLIADDHAIVRDGLVSLLKEAYDVVGAVGDGEALLEAASRSRPDVIVTDVSMPGLSGLEVLAALRAGKVASKVIVLTMHHDAELAAQALREGAAGFLLKQAAGEELIAAIEQALRGHVSLAPSLIKPVMEQMADPGAARVQLTRRQQEVLRLIVEGRRMKEIAAALQLSTRTVESHKYEMMEVLGVHSTAELIRYALHHRLVAE